MFFRRISTALEDLKQAQYFRDVLKSVSTQLERREIVEIVCFGLGNIGECVTSRYQLALLLLFKEFFKPVKVLVHDPIFYKDECKVLKKLGLEIIAQNQEGSYIISDDTVTLVYLPHCPIQLVNNFLWSNWGTKLKNCLLICNSFTTLNENQPDRVLSAIVPYINKIFPYIKEITLENSFKYKDIFNNTALHLFPKQNLNNIDPKFWLDPKKPHYDNGHEIITALMVEKLDI